VKRNRVGVKSILSDPDLRRKLMVSTIQATQAREGIETTVEEASKAYTIVTEADRATFFDLEPFRSRAGSDVDDRNEMFVKAVRASVEGVRHDVFRRDFLEVPGGRLVYSEVAVLGRILRENARLDPGWAAVRGGMNSTESDRFVRFRWETVAGSRRRWVRYSKGGEFSRFYSDLPLVFDWTDEGREFRQIVKKKYGSESRFVKSPECYFRRGLTWTEKSSLGFSVRILEKGAIFNVAGPAAFPRRADEEWYLLGVLNSALIAFAAWAMSGRNYGASYVSAMPIAGPPADRRGHVEELARTAFGIKATWDSGNEVSSRFDRPWLAQSLGAQSAVVLAEHLEDLLRLETDQDTTLRDGYDRLNDIVFDMYGVEGPERSLVVRVLGQVPQERVWPEAERWSHSERRIEHVWRLLSYLVKRVVEADDDGIVPIAAVNAEVPLGDRLRREMAVLFPNRDVSQLEVEIVNELKRAAKGYRRCQSLEDWLENVYFSYHVRLYKNRPVFWHISSAQGTAPCAFGALVHYQRFDKNRMAKLRATYLRDVIEGFKRGAALADKEGRAEDRLEWQAKVEEAQALDAQLQGVQEGRHEGPEGGDHDFRILTPWKTSDERPTGWDPDLDDGVKVNIEPLQKAGVLRIAKVV
jgi:hypothetical protein